ncbi:dihydrofolate synthetase fol3 [Trichoderma cornu-damae]|uniref:Dihydrofolate synthetase fol3 n=1 Tax=Trichoderma cornu-damae TaxID=654480 RepID=A0A9P8QEY5_9HYPO|nr:dihydrofolate synthetase fol3 [Trichoderma cornu-damae]
MPSAKEVNRALARIRAVMPAEKKVASGNRNIRLGLERIGHVVPREQGWLGVHVGGTNGKGSVCNLMSGLFRLSGISHGMYTSPAMPERHNGVTINGLYANRRMYEMEVKHVEDKFKRIASGWRFAAGEDPGSLTPFELETAAAFRIFDKMHVNYGIVEVGMGGATDATNAMRQKSVTVITKIDLDHQEYLGNTIEEIAKVKAGIMRPGVPCIVDHTNPSSVMKVLRHHASSVGTQISPSCKGESLLANLDGERFRLEDYERQNLLCAALAFRHLFPNLEIDVNRLLAMEPFPSGRKEQVRVLGLTGGRREKPILVDGAHNLLGSEALASYVRHQVREGDQPVSWVVGLSASKSKPFAKVISTLVQPQDNFAFVEYLPGPNEPPPAPAELGREIGKSIVGSESQLYDGDPRIGSGVQWACEKAGDGPVIVTGSLYLIRNLYMLDGVEPRRKTKTRRPGASQLWHYIQLSQKRALTAEEAREFKRARRHWYLSPARNTTFGAVRHGGQPRPSPVPERIRALQRQAEFHRRQAEGYRSAIESVEKDLAGEPDPAATETSDLRVSMETLKRHRQEHLSAYSSAMFKLRGRAAAPEKKYMSYEEVFGRPAKPKVPKFPFPEDGDVGATSGKPHQGAAASAEGGLAAPPGQAAPGEESGAEAPSSRFAKRSSRRDGNGKEKAAKEARGLVDKLARERIGSETGSSNKP